MSRKLVTKSEHRLVVYISADLRKEINGWLESEDVSLADFTRDALEMYLRKKQREQRAAELRETCQLLSSQKI